MKRSSFLKSLGIIVGSGMILPNTDTNIGVERMRITSSDNVGMGMLNPKQILEVTRRVNGGMPPLYTRARLEAYQ